jgi:hypothetical protein
VNLCQALQRIAERCERIGRENRLPARHGIILLQLVSFSGKWLATVNGAGLVASIALIITVPRWRLEHGSG